jgi:outer membrane protein OmpA-like peptidoglycan-associated protein
MKTRTRLSLAVAMAALSVACASSPKGPSYSVDLSSEPPGAKITFKGKASGTTPGSMVVRSEKELFEIGAKRSDEEVIEKRIRFVSSDHAEILFRFGTEPSALARKLGLRKVVVVEASERVSFDSGKAVLKPEWKPILERLAKVLETYFPGTDVFVCGHTDSTGSDGFNMRLSQDRARNVAKVLEDEGIKKESLKVQGFGKAFPIEGNDTPAGRGANRRTELVLPQ